MELPLYKEIAGYRPPLHEHSRCNAGLVFERFFSEYEEGCTGVSKDKTKWLRKFRGPRGNPAMLRRASENQLRLIRAAKGQAMVFEVEYRLVTGTGYPHPVENGLLWHPVWGVPYLSGSTIKGLVRSWLEAWEEEAEAGVLRTRLLHWFGSTDKNPRAPDFEAGCGDIIFFDAVPTAPVRLELDIMTPHMGQWYALGGEVSNVNEQPERIPADWHDPNPISFLVVSEATYLFGVAPRNGEAAERTDCREVLEALENALQWLGAGAKTAVGYGRMNPSAARITPPDMSPEEKMQYEIMSWDDKTIAKKFGPGFNATREGLKTRFGEHNWPLFIKLLRDLKGETIASWRESPKKTAEKKAFNKLQKAFGEAAENP